MIIKVCKCKEEAELGPKCLLGVAGLLVEFRIELVLLLHQVLEAAAGFPVLFLLGGWLHRCFGLLGIARGLVGFGLSVCVLGCAGRSRGGFAGLSWSGGVSVAPVEGAFRWRSGGDPQLVVVRIRVAGDDCGGLFAMFLCS